jgi:predicted nucleotidyltransferase
VRTKRAGQSALLLLDAVEVLLREKIDYAVIGAFALSAHGVVRASTDVDVLIFTTPQRLTKLRTRFQRAGFGTELRHGETDDPIPAMLILSDSHHNHVDLLGGLRGMDPAIFSRIVKVPFMGVDLCIVGREDFIAMKCFAGRPQDILDAQSAYRNAQGPVDLDLLRALARRFGRDAADRLEQVLAS